MVASHGPCLVRLSRYAEAEPTLRDAHRRLRETNQGKSGQMLQVIGALATVCEQTGRPDEATEWRRAYEELRQQRAASTRPGAPTTGPSTRP
jgi:hypothetical protein